MNDLEVRRLETFKRMGHFGALNADSFPAGTLAGELFKTVAGVVAELERHAAAQSSAQGTRRQGTAGKAVARAALLEDLEMISRTARGMAVVNPGLGDKFRFPRGQADSRLLAAARAFIQDAGPLKDEFVRHELPPTFIEDVERHMAEFGAASGGQSAGTGAGVSARAEIDAAIERGMNARRQLDLIVRNKLRNDPAGLAG